MYRDIDFSNWLVAIIGYDYTYAEQHIAMSYSS